MVPKAFLYVPISNARGVPMGGIFVCWPNINTKGDIPVDEC